MSCYRFDFLRANGDVFATHEIDYPDDKTAIAAGHRINAPNAIGYCFKVWRDGQLLHHHHNEPPSSD